MAAGCRSMTASLEGNQHAAPPPQLNTYANKALTRTRPFRYDYFAGGSTVIQRSAPLRTPGMGAESRNVSQGRLDLIGRDQPRAFELARGVLVAGTAQEI